MPKCIYCHEDKEKITKLRKIDDAVVCRDCNTKRKQKYRLSETGKRKVNEASKRARIKHREKFLARAKVRYAVKIGKIEKPKKCEVCEKVKSLQGHHEDYSKPLEVIWLCSGCHADADALLLSKK